MKPPEAHPPLAPLPFFLLALFLLAPPASLRAQSGPVREGPPLSIDAMVAWGSPKGDLAKYNVDGVYWGVGLGWRFSPRFTLRLDGALDKLNRNGSPNGSPTFEHLGGSYGPYTDFWHYMTGISAELTTPGATRWEVAATGELGGTYINEKGSPTIAPFKGSEFTVYTGLQVAYDFTPSFSLFGRAGWYILFGNGKDPAGSYLGKEDLLIDGAGIRVRF